MLLKLCHINTIFYFGSAVILTMLLFSSEVTAQEIAPNSDTLPLSIDSSLFSPPSVPIENRLKYSRNILNQSFDFKLQPISSGKFEINISGSPRTNLSVKV